MSNSRKSGPLHCLISFCSKDMSRNQLLKTHLLKRNNTMFPFYGRNNTIFSFMEGFHLPQSQILFREGRAFHQTLW